MMAKKDQEPIPEIDESLLTPAQKKEMHSKQFGIGWYIFFGVMLTLIIACIIVIIALPK